MTSTGQLLKAKRMELNLSQRAVAKLIGMTNVSLNYIERGQRALPAKYVNSVCRVLQLEKLSVATAMKEDQEVQLEKKIR
jgi:transcriptional regulator with XRE-family HTH domain